MSIPWFGKQLGPVHAVIVHTRTDQAIRGLLADRTKLWLVLRPASVAGQDPLNPSNVVWTPLDGDVVIPWDNIDFWQEGVDAALAGIAPELYG